MGRTYRRNSERAARGSLDKKDAHGSPNLGGDISLALERMQIHVVRRLEDGIDHPRVQTP